ncbi:MAG TPA: hypothetical protein VFA18_23465, partial [Gemmataceae bacterium]|nr:hypothetical protein [Gemmataceae bacterium]
MTKGDHDALYNQHYYEVFSEELRMLLKVQQYFRRHPDAKGCITPHFARVLASDEWEVREQLLAGVPFDEIELPPEQLPSTWRHTREDAEVLEYLHTNHFALEPRLKFVVEEVERLIRSERTARCSCCHDGLVRVAPEDWD